MFPPSGRPGHVGQLVVHLTKEPEVPGLILIGHINLCLLLLIQEGQLSNTGESMCKKYSKFIPLGVDPF